MNCVIEKNISIKVLIDTYANINCINQKYIGKLKIIYYDESNSIETLNAFYFTLRKVNLHISFDDGEKHKSIPVKFIVFELDQPDYYFDLILEIL